MLKDSLKIKNTVFSNRLVMPPMATAKSGPDGDVTDDLCEYYKSRAAGGYIGTIITEHSYYCQQGKASAGQVSFASDDKIDGLKKLVNAIHEGGAKVIAQLNHAGSATTSAATGMPVVSASAVINPGIKPGTTPEMPVELTKEEISEIQDKFVEAALRAKAAGYDGVEIHSAHGYLLNQFYSPLTNKRTDEYGPQSVENRTRFAVEMYRKARKALGEDYLIFIRLGGCDYMEGGSTIEDAVEAAKIFEKEGIDLIDISGGMCRYLRSDNSEPGYFSDMSLAVKKAVSVPVILTGGITTAGQAEKLLEEGAADLIGVGRAMMKDAEWAAKNMADVK
jgi:NADPH2 dehydrogenase